jgi:hypothetical protein
MNSTPARPPIGATNANLAAMLRPPIDFRAAIKKGQSMNPPRIAMIGVEGIGKSTAGSEMENPIFLCAENGLVGPQFAKTESYRPATWLDVLDFIDFLINEAHEFKSLVIDTLDWLESILFAYVCKRDNKVDIDDYGYGKGLATVAPLEFNRLIAKLEILNANGVAIMFLCHSTIKGYVNPSGDDYNRFEPKVSKQLAGIVKEWVDAVLFAQFETFTEKAGRLSKAKAFGGQRRVVYTEHSAAWDAKNRYGLPNEMELDMPSIMEAIKSGNGASGESVESLTKEILDLSTLVIDEIRLKIEADVAKAGADAAALGRILNKTRSSVTKYAKENAQ